MGYAGKGWWFMTTTMTAVAASYFFCRAMGAAYGPYGAVVIILVVLAGCQIFPGPGCVRFVAVGVVRLQLSVVHLRTSVWQSGGFGEQSLPSPPSPPRPTSCGCSGQAIAHRWVGQRPKNSLCT